MAFDMKSNNFVVRIHVDGKPVPKIPNTNIFPLKHGTEYSIYLQNNHADLDADADIYIDSEKIGRFRIRKKEAVKIERPGAIAQKFTFYKEGSVEAVDACIGRGKLTNGNIRIEFLLEKKHTWVYRCDGTILKKDVGYDHWGIVGNPGGPIRTESDTYHVPTTDRIYYNAAPSYNMENNITRGIRPLTNQCFNQTTGYESGGTGLGLFSDQTFRKVSELDYDYDKKTVINLRLVIGEKSPTPIRSLASVRNYAI